MQYEVVEHTYVDPWTHVRIREFLSFKGRLVTLVGDGFARRMATDPPDLRVGFELALSRARADVRKKRDEYRRRRK